MKPLLRWAGSKRKLLLPLKKYWEESNSQRYIEPFCGSACLYFEIEPEVAILGDTNSWLIDTYKAIRSNGKGVIDKLYSLKRSKKIYCKIRQIHYSRFNEVNRAAYLLYLNRLCFNGLFRTNKRQLFNVPYSNNKTGSYPDPSDIIKASSLLSKAELSDDDFFDTIYKNVKRGDFVYLDPPYATNNYRIFRQYNASTFGVSDICRLKELLSHIDNVGAKFVLSYGEASEIEEIKNRWLTLEMSAQRNIAGFSKARKIEKEYIIKNF